MAVRFPLPPASMMCMMCGFLSLPPSSLVWRHVAKPVRRPGRFPGRDTRCSRPGWTGRAGFSFLYSYGFGDGAYTSTVNGDTIQFEAVTTSPTKGKMTWKGTVQGDRIEVGYVWLDASHWYKPNPKPLEKWAKGELKR